MSKPENLSELAAVIKDFAKRYPNDGYDKGFKNLVKSDSLEDYGSWANGSAMRVSFIGFNLDTLEECLEQSKLTAMTTHNSEEDIKRSQTITVAIFLAKNNLTKEVIKNKIVELFNYDLDRKIVDIRANYKFDVSCEGSVPESIIFFLDSTDYESAIYNAISLGSNSDTQACMAGGIAKAYYKKFLKNL